MSAYSGCRRGALVPPASSRRAWTPGCMRERRSSHAIEANCEKTPQDQVCAVVDRLQLGSQATLMHYPTHRVVFDRAVQKELAHALVFAHVAVRQYNACNVAEHSKHGGITRKLLQALASRLHHARRERSPYCLARKYESTAKFHSTFTLVIFLNEYEVAGVAVERLRAMIGQRLGHKPATNLFQKQKKRIELAITTENAVLVAFNIQTKFIHLRANEQMSK
jgi:hypothetical protein